MTTGLQSFVQPRKKENITNLAVLYSRIEAGIVDET
jgi:hypothetical protein